MHDKYKMPGLLSKQMHEGKYGVAYLYSCINTGHKCHADVYSWVKAEAQMMIFCLYEHPITSGITPQLLF